MIDQWEKPQEVDGVTLAFPADVSHLMPKMADIGTPPEKWVRFQQDWFFAGIDADGLVAREGIDKAAALRHLRAIQGSYAPKHEHKEAAVAYLASRWFTDESTWTAKPVRVGGISV